MPRTKTKRTIKVVKSFYTFHPDFILEMDGTPHALDSGYWAAEWTVKELNNHILEHYMAKFETEEQAKELLKKIGDITGFFSLYKTVSADCDIFTAGEFIAFVDPRKKFSGKIPKND